MARIIDLKVEIGSSVSNMNLLPCAISVANPIISWKLPDDIIQKRFNVRINPVDNSGLYIHGQTVGTQTTYRYPDAYSLSSKFYGLCELEIAISERTSGEFEYTSGKLYFVYDDKLEILKNSDSYEFKWSNATDREQAWKDIQYNLIVSSSVYFNDEDIIFNEHINATSSNETSCIVNFDKKYDFVYWKVRAFDGFDYGDFTQVNAFRITDNNAPSVEISNIEPLNDSNKDVKIDFSIIDSENDRLNLEVYYCGGTVGNKYQLASLINSVVSVKPGKYSIIWRSSLDEKKIKSSDYRIKITVIDDEGLYSEDTSDIFSMDNSTVGLEEGGNASINNDYIVVGSMAVVRRSDISDEVAPLCGKVRGIGDDYREDGSRLYCNIGSFKKYRTGNLNYKLSSPDPDKNSSQGSPDDFVWGNGSSGGDGADIEPWYPVGMAIFQNRRKDPGEDDSGGSGGGEGGGNDLDSGDPNFIRSLNVDSEGNYHKMDERISYKSGSDLRNGYARFLTYFYACKDAICPKCGGKGWYGVELDKNADQGSRYKYRRKSCPTCFGNRFTEPNISPEKVDLEFKADIVKKNEPITLTGGKNLLEEDFTVSVNNGETLDSSCYLIDCSKNSVTFLNKYIDVIINYKMEKYKVENTIYKISRWIPLEKYFSPFSRSELLHLCKIGDSRIIDPRKNFIFGMTTPSSWYSSYSYGNSNSKSGYVFSPKELSEDTYYQIDCNTLSNKTYNIRGVYNGINFEGKSGVKIQHDLSGSLDYIVEGYAHVEKLKLKEHVSPVTGKIITGIKDYIPGTTYYESVLSLGRKIPTHKWEPGLFIFEGNLHREQNLGSIKIIFLQSNWQVYNTIHWTAPASASSLTQVQYCRINDNGSNGVFYDVIAENSDYYEEQGSWFIPPQTWHCFWKTEDQISRDNNNQYRIRIRQYNLISKTFTDWSYSDTTFSLKDSSTNPANIYYVEYQKFSKKLYIYFKLDDKDNEDFNITSVSYSVEGGGWKNISKTDIDGDLFNLSSNKGPGGNDNKHLIVWDTSSYSLKASDDYRIRIEVVKTKLVSGYSKPLLKWIKTPNTTSDIAERTIETYRGSWIRTYWDEEEKKAKALNPPIFHKGRIGELEDKIFEIKCQNEPLPNTCNGYYTFLHDGAVDIERDSNGKIISANVKNAAVVNSIEINGDTYYLNDWLNYKIDGVSRNSLIYNYSREINSCIEIINSANKTINESRNYVRRTLIDQGYYCNGFKNNTPKYIEDGSNSVSIDEGSYFKFKVLTYFDDSKNENGFYEPRYSEYLGDVLFTITKEDESGDGKIVTTKYDFHEYERTSDVFSRIVMDKYSRYNSQNGKPLRDFIFINEERIATHVGGDNYNGATNSDKDKNKVDSVNSSKYEVFTIPLEYLPGEKEGDITDSDTFEGDYKWKVSSYNLLYGRPEERPEFNATSVFSGNVITLSVKTTAPTGMTDAKINEIYFVDKLFDKFLIEKDNSNSLSESFDDSNSLYGNDILSETVFVTDPPDYALSRGDCASFTWTPLSKYRTRPIVVIDKFNDKLFWYLKDNVYGEKVVCMAKGKTVFRVGEYDMAIPSKNEKIETEIIGAKNIFSHSVVYINGLYIMYYIVDIDDSRIVKLSTSLDGNTWTNGEAYLPISGVYNLFATVNNNSIELYCCTYDGVFNVYKLTSNNGSDFQNNGIYYSSNSVISNIFVLNYLDKSILFYTEEEYVDDEYVYNIKNNSNGIFPEIKNASNPFIIKEGLGYRMFFDRNGKIFSIFLKNYIEKNIVKNNSDLGSVVAGDLSEVRSLDTGYVTTFSIDRNYHEYNSNYFCTDYFREIDLNNIVGWVIKGENNAKYKEYRVEGEFLTEDNKNLVEADMDPFPFRYMSIVKDMY